MFNLDTHKILVDSQRKPPPHDPVCRNNRFKVHWAESNYSKANAPYLKPTNIEYRKSSRAPVRASTSTSAATSSSSPPKPDHHRCPNTGGFVGARNFDETIFRTNLGSLPTTVARGLRLRNLGGIIIIDFIGMWRRKSHREAVLQELRQSPRFRPTRVTLNGFYQFGPLSELTRKRSRETLSQILLPRPCPSCQGLGRLKTPQTVCYEIQREIVREASPLRCPSLPHFAAPNVIDLFPRTKNHNRWQC